jgi:hypothetical protein
MERSELVPKERRRRENSLVDVPKLLFLWMTSHCDTLGQFTNLVYFLGTF